METQHENSAADAHMQVAEKLDSSRRGGAKSVGRYTGHFPRQ